MSLIEKEKVGKKRLEVASAEFRADEVENENGLIGLEEEEDASSDSFNEM